MKTALQISILFIAIIVFSPQQSDAQVKAGVGVAFGSEIEQVGIQGDLHYRLTNQPAFQFGAGFVYYFPENNFNYYEANINGAWIFYEEFMFKSYFYTGLNYAHSEINSAGTSVSDSALGLNAGLGAEYDLGPVLAFGDLKYIISDFDQAVFTIGLRLPF